MESDGKEDEVVSPERQPLGASFIARERQEGIQWERFLPTRSLRVLLVEYDDSTRHIVAALLRKCCYQVTAVPDGLKAWKVMTQKNCIVDIVLTEVGIPSLSGVCLLEKIVGTEECKNIPVIMMSSEDSVNIVLKCMLKGAADFLVKPLRKNELRNLWQHVWRRQRSINDAHALNKSAAGNICSAAGNQSQTGENSDECSNAQTLGSEPDSRIEISRKHGESALAKQDCSQGAEEEYEEQAVNNVCPVADSLKEVDFGAFRDKTLVDGHVVVTPVQKAFAIQSRGKISYGVVDLGSLRSAKDKSSNPSSSRQTNAPEESLHGMVGFMQSLSNVPCSYPAMETIAIKESRLSVDTKASQMNHALDSSASTLRELFSRGPQLNDRVQCLVKEGDRLNHSNASAFSRYGGNTTEGACEKLNSQFICIKGREYVDQSQSHVIVDHDTEKPNLPNFASNAEGEIQIKTSSDGNVEDFGTLSSGVQKQEAFASHNVQENTFFCGQYPFLPTPIPVGAFPYPSVYTGFGALMQPLVCTLIQQNSASVECAPCENCSDNPAHHGDLCIGHSKSNDFCNGLAYPRPDDERDATVVDQRDLSCTWKEQLYQCGSCGKDTLKDSRNNRSSETEDAAVAICTALESGKESGVQNGFRKGTYSVRFNREAALVKFRLKRKARCFEKKVRYHSRKKFAEQRPRVKGQFVRKRSPENTPTQIADG